MRIIGQEQVAEAFGVAPKTIVEWQEQGFPVAVRGRPGVPSEYDLPACIDWLVRREVTKVQGESPRDRVLRLQGDSLELELAQQRGKLVDVDSVEPSIQAAVVAARELLLRERRRLVLLLEGATSERRDELLAEVHEAFLRRLANWRAAVADEEHAA